MKLVLNNQFCLREARIDDYKDVFSKFILENGVQLTRTLEIAKIRSD